METDHKDEFLGRCLGSIEVWGISLSLKDTVRFKLNTGFTREKLLLNSFGGTGNNVAAKATGVMSFYAVKPIELTIPGDPLPVSVIIVRK